jgi:ribonuclease P protein component
VLKREHRLTDGPSFGLAIRTGRRAGSRTVVVHVAAPDLVAVGLEPDRPARIGLVVGRTVGNAVARNQVKRRLRHLMRERVDSLPLAALVVVRALPAAAGASYDELAADLDHALGRALRPRGPRRTTSAEERRP